MRTLLRIAVSGALLALVAERLDLSAALAALRNVSSVLFARAVVVYLLAQVVAAGRWTILARGAGFHLSLMQAVRVNMIALFFGLAVPTTAGTDATRAYYLGGTPPGRVPAISCIIFDRLMAFVTLALACALAAAAGVRPGLPPIVSRTASVAGFTLVLGWMSAPLVAGLLPEESRVRRLVHDDLGAFFHDPAVLGGAALASLAVVALQIVSQKLLADAVGIGTGLGFVAFYHAVVVVAGSLPVSIAGFGMREAAYVYVMALAHVAAEQATALSLLWFAVGILTSLCGGLVFVLVGLPGETAARGSR